MGDGVSTPGVPLDDGDEVPDGVDVAVELGDGVGVGAPEPLTSTWRKRSSAVCLTVSRIDLSCLPGIEMTMLLEAVVTSDSATPKLSTRLRMIATAWFSVSLVIFPVSPGASRGVRMTLVPPSRSSPSLGW